MDDKQAEALIQSPSENLTLELKTWLDLNDQEQKAKLIRALLALRNFNGGYVIIGFDDKTGVPSPNSPDDPRTSYHSDDLQRLVATYASEPFGIEVKYPERDGVIYPVILVPAGVQVPVAVKKDIQNTGSKVILSKGSVLFRTLGANSTVSSAAAAPEDWRQIMEICFNNREADLGRFVRRHLLGGELPSLLAELGLLAQQDKRPGLEAACRAFADRCEAYMVPMEQQRGILPLPETFGWVEIAAVLDPPVSEFIADQVFLTRLMNYRPSYSRDLWLDGRFDNQRPVTIDSGWNTLVDMPGYWDLREFSRLEPIGRFYLKRPLAEDASAKARAAQTGVSVDLQTTIGTVAQAMAVVLEFTRALGAKSDETKIGFLLRYKGLKNRRLISLNSMSMLSITSYHSSTDTFDKFVEFPANISSVNLGGIVYEAVREFLALFNGFSVTLNQVEQAVRADLRLD